ncbi:hypothetical protein H5410_041957, partial [Solanum commersonii]
VSLFRRFLEFKVSTCVLPIQMGDNMVYMIAVENNNILYEISLPREGKYVVFVQMQRRKYSKQC